MKNRFGILFLLLTILVGCNGRGQEEMAASFPIVTPPSMLESSQDRAEYLALHFWDSFADTNRLYSKDTSLVGGVRKSDLEHKFVDWVSNLSMVNYNVAVKSIDNLYSKVALCEAKDSASNIFETLNQLVHKYFYDPNSPYRYEDLYGLYAEKLSKSPYIDETMKLVYEYDVQMCEKNRIGTKAANFKFKDIKGNIFQLDDIKADWILLFFSNPGCTACMEIINNLKSSPEINYMISTGKLAVLNIYIDEDIDAWKSYMPIYPDTWYNGYDPDYKIRTDILYNVRAIPSLYVLDKDKTVLMKDAEPDNVLSFFFDLFTRTMKINKELWGKSACGEEIYLYTITNESGAYVKLSSIGAGIVSIVVPDKEGKLDDVVLGYPDPMSYFGDGPCAGKIPGRFANRIANGRFTLEGKEYQLPINNGSNHLHGGPDGFQNKVWESRINGDAVEFLYYSEDGEMGYPGALKVVARYDWSEENELRLTIIAESDAPTIINLTNHAYFNLDGEGSGSVLDHLLRLNASEYLPTDENLVPLGESVPVAGTPMDFVTGKPLGRDIKADFPALKYGKGYDNCFVIDGTESGQLQEAAILHSLKSGRTLSVYTTQPAVQVYTGNWLSGCPIGKCGRSYNDYDGVAIECQNFPDAPNNEDFPSAELYPGEVYEEAIIFAFSVEK